MEFFAVNGIRPKRLSEETRLFAYESLCHKYGKMTDEAPYVALDGAVGYEKMTHLGKYDTAIRYIAERSPIRICAGELVSGAATLGLSIHHNVPAAYKGKWFFEGSISHLTVDFETVLKKGVNYITEKAEKSLEKYRGTEKEAFIVSCLSCLESMKIWHGRYIEALTELGGYEDNIRNLERVPFEPAESFYEAVQSLWFTFAFLRITGNWPGIGRIDHLLGDYLESDLEKGKITLDGAREILAHFFIKGCEWVKGGDYISGDAQHYQNIVLGGIDEDGREVTNAVTYLVLDIIEETGISDFPVTVRINKNTEEKLLKRVSEVISYGGGVVAVYNEETVIKSLVSYGYDEREARRFANDGCWEIQIPGSTYFSYMPFDSLQILQKNTLDCYSGKVVYESFEELYGAFVSDLREHVEGLGKWRRSFFEETDKRIWKKTFPCTVVSLFERGCIEKGLSYLEGGPLYNITSPHIGGLPDTANSLYAVKKLVFEDKKVSFEDLMDALRNNWEGQEDLRRFAMTKYSYFGNDNDEVDLIAARIVSDFADICDSLSGSCGYSFPAGISTFGRQLEWSPSRLSTPSGRKAGEILSGNFSPTPGTDFEGPTSIISSYCKADFTRTVSGAALDVMLDVSAVKGEEGVFAVSSLIKGFVRRGGHFLQLDVADTELLRKAQSEPENYQSLSVRVSGWNARFVTLDKEWQDMIIAQREKTTT
ncbi:MAG: hypothetical protein E7660_02585 [Ruminococcaceae bacterium]|nr:hypothetical protein [Oscillospiraceae bacterium]